MKMLLALLCLGMLLPVPAWAQTPAPAPAGANAQPALGRLFLSPERRTVLERQRQLNIRETPTLETESLQLNGVVQRSSGRNSVWVNGQVQSEAGGAVNVRVNRRNPAHATVSTGSDGATDLRVGETINRSTRERSDVVKPDAVRPDSRTR